jgi:hypothetical protein
MAELDSVLFYRFMARMHDRLRPPTATHERTPPLGTAVLPLALPPCRVIAAMSASADVGM